MEELFKDTAKDLGRDGGRILGDEKLTERQAERVNAARSAWLEDKLKTPQDLLWCAAVLGNSQDLEDIVLAHRLAVRADQEGERRGRTLAAEIEDKERVKRNLPQRYGTQIVFDRFSRTYRLHEVDPKTTDAERAEVGLPSLAELRARAESAEQSWGKEARSGPKPKVEVYYED